MPIDLARIAADWAEAWRAQQRAVANAFTLLGPWLAGRLEQLRSLEQRSRGFPVFAFEGRALSLSIVAAQHGTVRPYASTGAAVAAPFVAFGRGFARVGQAVEDEWILPGVLGAVERVLVLILASIDRFMRPAPGMFDPRRAQASDLFGLLAMGWRGLAHSTAQLRAYARDVAGEIARRSGPAAAGAPAGGTPLPPAQPGAPEAASPNPLADDVQRWLAGAILVLPAIPAWIETLARAAWLRARDLALDQMESIERELFDLRATVLRAILVDLPVALREVPALVATLGAMVEWNIRYFARLAQVWFELAVFAIDLFLRGVHWVVNGFLSLLNTLIALVDGIMNFDLLLFIKPMMGPAGVLIDMMGVRLTLNDLIDAGTGMVNFAVKNTLKAAIHTARGLVLALTPPQIPLVNPSPTLSDWQRTLLRKLDLMEQVVDALFADTGGPMVETAAPRLTSMPNFYDLLFGAPPQDLADALRGFGHALADNMRGLFDTAAATLQDFAAVFDRTTADLARTGPAGRMREFGRRTQGLVGDLYDDQIRALGDRIRETPANSFERWLVQGGFEIIGAAIPLYMAEMRRWWHEQAEAGNAPVVDVTPTSPHILVRRARLARVHMPRLTLRATGRAHDEALVREIAGRCRGAFEAAYLEGHRRLRALQAAAS